MTNQLPGNEYAKLADDQMNYIYESGQINESDHSGRVIFQALNAIVQSNLAVAYEMRTANLIANDRLGIASGAGPIHEEEIFPRLGRDTND